MMTVETQETFAPARIADKAFLGPEFVTWLYFTIIEDGFEVEVPEAFPLGTTAPEDGIVRFAVGKRLALRSLDATGAKVTLAGAGLEDSGEVLQAIRRGALLETMSLDMAVGDRVYSFTLSATDGGLSGVKLPDLFTDPGEGEEEQAKKSRPRLPFEDVLSLRMQAMDEIDRVIDALFARFVTRRIANAWATDDTAAIRRRVAAGLRERQLDLL